MKATDNISRQKLKVRLILIAVFLLVLICIFSLKNYPGVVEKYYSGALYPAIRKGLHFVFNYIPFSVGDLVYLITIISVLVGFIKVLRLLFRRKAKIAGFMILGFILKLEMALCAFYLLWALNYFREPPSKRLHLPDYAYTSAELIKVTSMLIDSANSNRSFLTGRELHPSQSEITLPAIAAVKDLTTFKPHLIAISPTPKPSLLSFGLNYIGITGYFNPFTGEAQYNDRIPGFTKPFVACHEMAHQMGFGAEDEANFAGFIAGKSSDNRLLKYSAYYLAAQEFMAEVWRTDSIAFKNLKGRISPAMVNDLNTERQYWRKYQGETSRLSSIFYDNYLKANNQPAGLKTYNRMIRLSMSYYRQRRLAE